METVGVRNTLGDELRPEYYIFLRGNIGLSCFLGVCGALKTSARVGICAVLSWLFGFMVCSRPVTGGYYNGGSINNSGNGYWWSSTVNNSNNRYNLNYNGSSLNTNNNNRNNGMYIRCVR